MSATDFKNRFGGILENPFISRIQRNLLDGGRNRHLAEILSPYKFSSVLDVGCGLGETSEIISGQYTGVDDSEPRIQFASRRYPSRQFFVGDARKLSFGDHSFDAGFLIDTSHHLSDDIFLTIITEMSKICSGFLVISDPVPYAKQNFLSKFFYRLDRGGCFRSVEEMEALFAQVPAIEKDSLRFFTTTPGLYYHAVFVFKVKKPEMRKT